MPNKVREPSLDLLWGASAIAAALGLEERQAFYLLQQGLLPARKIGRQWMARRSELDEHLSAEQEADDEAT